MWLKNNENFNYMYYITKHGKGKRFGRDFVGKSKKYIIDKINSMNLLKMSIAKYGFQRDNKCIKSG